jgi:orotate phosphoribosyltransferase
MRARVLAAIRDRAILRGTFTLRSGRTSNYYVDKYVLTTDPEILRGLGALLAQHVPAGVDRIAGAELGGIPLVSAVMLETHKPGIFVRNSRKEYGTAKLLEGALEPGESVVLLEDVCTTGGQILEAADVIAASDAKVACIIAVIDREEGARQAIEKAGYSFVALYRASELTAIGGE